jgi:fructose-bisphosphate aldolase, class II
VPLVTTGELVARAWAAGHGLAACNVITLEHAEAVAAGAEAAGRPVVLQVSQNAVRFHGGRLEPISAACRSVAAAAGVPVSLHLDHVQDDRLLRRAAAAGYSSAMVDAAGLPYADNVAATRAAAAWAHDADLWLEAELGEVGGKDGAHAPWVRTDPAQAEAYVEATGVDALAVAVGSAHAMTTPTARLDLDLIARLRGAVPVPLVLHGSSGVPAPELRRAVALGIVKVNIGTAFNLAFTTAVRQHLTTHPDVVDPRRYLRPAREAMAEAVRQAVATVSTPTEPGPGGGGAGP